MKQLTVKLAKEIEDKERLRQLRDKYRLEVYELRKKTKVLQDKLDNLTSNNQASDHNLMIDSNDKDNCASQQQFSQRLTIVASNHFIPASKSQTPVSTTRTTIEIGKNKKYPNIPLFYGNRDDKER